MRIVGVPLMQLVLIVQPCDFEDLIHSITATLQGTECTENHCTFKCTRTYMEIIDGLFVSR